MVSIITLINKNKFKTSDKYQYSKRLWLLLVSGIESWVNAIPLHHQGKCRFIAHEQQSHTARTSVIVFTSLYTMVVAL